MHARPLPVLLRSLARLAAPVAIARLGIMGMGIADTVVVGQLAPDDLPALALGWAPTGVLLVTGIGLLTGVQVLTARVLGEGRPTDAGAVWRRGLVISLVAGIVSIAALATLVEPLLVAFGIEPALAAHGAAVSKILGVSVALHYAYVCSAFFVEAVQRPVSGTIVIWAANGVNLALNLLLVPELGARGSAWATVGGRAFMFTALAGWILASPAGRTYGVRARAPHAPSYRALLAVGGAAAVSQLAEAGAFSSLTVIAGRIGASSVAAYQLLLNTLAVVFMISLGVATATAVLVAEAWGRRDAHEAGRAGWAGLGVNSIAMVICAAVLLAFATTIAGSLTSDVALAAVVAGLMPVAALVLVPDGGQVVVAAALRGRGDNWLPTASHILSYVVVMPPLAWWLGERSGRGVAGLMEAIVVASFLSVIVLMMRLRRISQ
ncbi:MAG TPA: MATE family efflux transporter [Candidatus Limnocylindrales bacterium]|nr:MATE family efflux transporter [Candidatus Limnocylindrales bacterium]